MLSSSSVSTEHSGSGVHVQAFGIMLETLRDQDIPVEPLLEGLSFDLPTIHQRRGRVPWDDFARFMERFEKALGGDYGAAMQERFHRRAEYGAFRHLMRMAISPRMGFNALNRWFGPSWFPVVKSELEWFGPREGVMTLRIPEPYLDSPAFLRLNRIAFEATGQMLSGRPTRVTLNLRCREGRYHIYLPPSRTVGARLRRLQTWRHPDARVLATLNEQQEELRTTVHALRETESRYRQILEQSGVGVWRLDPETQRLNFVSSAVKDVLGYEPEEMKVLPLEQLILPADFPVVEEMLGSLYEGRSTNDREIREVRHVRKDGRVIWCEVRAAAIRDESGHLLAIQGMTDDITARKEVERERERAAEAEQKRDRAEQASRFKDALLASMSHEIRTPLTSQMGFAQLLLRELAGTPHEKPLQVIERSSRRLLTLLSNMLELARVESGQEQYHPETYPIRRTVAHVAELLRLEADNKNLSLTMDVPADLLVCSDHRRDEQILLNVIGNAIRYTDKGGIRIEGRAFQEDGEAVGVELRVIDTGIGISAEFLPHVYEDFRQEVSGGQHRAGGTGLGLAITRRLLESIGGRIAIESEKGRGTTVTLRFPVKEGAGVSPPEPPPSLDA